MAGKPFDAKEQNLMELIQGHYLFKVPDYQRLYSWGERNWKEFLRDLIDAFKNNMPHYLGSIILRRARDKKCGGFSVYTVYEVIDGQQRLTTLIIMLKAINDLLGDEVFSLKRGNCFVLELGNLNEEFFRKFLGGESFSREDLRFLTNRLIRDAYEYFKAKLGELDDIGGFIDFLYKKLFVVKTEVEDEKISIKIFETINDRGRPLTYIDKLKSFLMFVSTKHLAGKFNEEINLTFSQLFRNFEYLRELARITDVSYFRGLSEDDLLRFVFHYLGEGLYGYVPEYPYDASLESIFNAIKQRIDDLSHSKSLLEEFLKELLITMKGVLRSVLEILLSVLIPTEREGILESFGEHEVEFNPRLCKLVRFLGPIRHSWILLILLKLKGWLDDKWILLLETLDLRVYKLVGSQVRRDLYLDIIIKLKNETLSKRLETKLKDFIRRVANDYRIVAVLNGHMYGNPATKYILWEYVRNFQEVEDCQRYPDRKFKECSIKEFEELEVEHILPRSLDIDPSSFGFSDRIEYEAGVNKIGNLSLLKSNLNQRCKNRLPSSEGKYLDDCYKSDENKNCELYLLALTNRNWNKGEIDRRTKRITEFVLNRWKV
ncbi:DUF262 domain-containing protein [Phorcysia thermohydrogeniphila]|uniref:Uncharacterized protein DUF1524 n=1 Tax=Phorcysia thermohydrogeniphila TaxID=936138 RepID=A0A4V6NCV7_9BACT|nr:DUF262 domain-containing protein [Phorcysia thermohydrogeniphila]TCK02486.1 uncharacterized protein DUF1524 [Phorcysia thermohydrogeniphila]